MADEPAITLYVADLLTEFGEMTSTDARQIHALTAFATNGMVGAACKSAGVSRWAWVQWRRRDEAFERLYQQILEAKAAFEGERIADVQEKLYELAEAGNVDAIKTILKAKVKEYRDKQVIEVVSPDVQDRLRSQADMMMLLCATELPEPHRTTFPVLLASKLREIWS